MSSFLQPTRTASVMMNAMMYESLFMIQLKYVIILKRGHEVACMQ
jgi:hypothetical protein